MMPSMVAATNAVLFGCRSPTAEMVNAAARCPLAHSTAAPGVQRHDGADGDV